MWAADEQLVGRWDGDARLFVVTGWTYGPAGPARVELAPGLIVSVDFVNPTVTHEIVIEAALSGDPTALDAAVATAAAGLLGPTVLQRLVALARGNPPHHAVRIADERDRQPTPEARQLALARFVVLAETATSRDVADVNAAVAGLEAAAVAPVADPELNVLGPAAAILAADAAAQLLDAVRRGSFEITDRRAADELVVVIDRAMTVVGDDILARRLRQFGDELGSGSFSGYPRAATAVAASAPMQSAGPRQRRMRFAATEARPLRRERVAVDGVPGAMAEQTGPTEIEVSAPPNLDGQWARVFRRHDRLLLALAPLRPRRGQHGALLVVPTGLQPEDLVVDITDEPEAPRPSDPLIRVRAAVAAGRQACRHERMGDERAATQSWAACAEQWAAAGDRDRADTAARYASGDRAEPRGRGRTTSDRGGLRIETPFLADRLGSS